MNIEYNFLTFNNKFVFDDEKMKPTVRVDNQFEHITSFADTSHLLNKNLLPKSAICDSNVKEKKRQSASAHRLVEKRRRDRMNEQLDRLRNLLPLKYNGKNKVRLEKVEVLELASENICTLQQQLMSSYDDCFTTKNNFNDISNISYASTKSPSNLANEKYNEGLKRGMEVMIEYLKKSNQMDAQINDALFQLAYTYKNNLNKTLDDETFTRNSTPLIASTPRSCDLTDIGQLMQSSFNESFDLI